MVVSGPAAPGEATELARRARWDVIEGVRLWHMAWRLSWNEVRRRYRRTLLGPMWVTVSLMVFAVALSYVWSSLWKQDVKTYLPFLLSGMLPWSMISGSITESCTSLLAAEPLVKTRQFPYTSLVYVVLARNAVIFLHNLLGYVLIAAVCGVAPAWMMLLFLPGALLVVLNCAWISIVLSIFCLRFRDLQLLVASLLQIAMFVTPVFWSADQLLGKRAIIVDVNLLYHMIEIVREPLLGKSAALVSYAVCACAALLGWTFAYLLLVRKRHRLAYWF